MSPQIQNDVRTTHYYLTLMMLRNTPSIPHHPIKIWGIRIFSSTLQHHVQAYPKLLPMFPWNEDNCYYESCSPSNLYAFNQVKYLLQQSSRTYVSNHLFILSYQSNDLKLPIMIIIIKYSYILSINLC